MEKVEALSFRTFERKLGRKFRAASSPPKDVLGIIRCLCFRSASSEFYRYDQTGRESAIASRFLFVVKMLSSKLSNAWNYLINVRMKS